MTSTLLCLAILTAHPLPDAIRGCTLAPHAVDANPSDPALLLAIAHVETRWQTGLVGAAGERGPWQVLPQFTGLSPETVAVPSTCAREASRMLSRWLRRSGGNVRRALGAYNCGTVGLSGACDGYARRVLRVAMGML